MTKIRKGADKNLTLSQLAQWIEGKESIHGPLVEIDCARGGTVGTFDDDGDTPDTAPTVILDPEGSATCASGAAKVCKGRAYVSGTCVAVLICR